MEPEQVVQVLILYTMHEINITESFQMVYVAYIWADHYYRRVGKLKLIYNIFRQTYKSEPSFAQLTLSLIHI